MSPPTAILRLRSHAGPVEAQIHFPPKNTSGRLVVAFVGAATAEELCSTLDAVIIAMSPAGANTQPLLEWIAAHAAELGASTDAIAVTGTGSGANHAQEMVAAARSGWPPLELLTIETALTTNRMNSTKGTDMTTSTITRTLAATPEEIWELWTTAAGIEQWWAPDGFATTVQQLNLAPGGELTYTMTATHPDQVAFMQQHGLPLATESHKTFTEIQSPIRLAYTSLIDFVPDHAAYDQHTVVELQRVEDGTLVTMTMDPMHDETWTERLVAGRTNELDNLARIVSAA